MGPKIIKSKSEVPERINLSLKPIKQRLRSTLKAGTNNGETKDKIVKKSHDSNTVSQSSNSKRVSFSSEPKSNTQTPIKLTNKENKAKKLKKPNTSKKETGVPKQNIYSHAASSSSSVSTDTATQSVTNTLITKTGSCDKPNDNQSINLNNGNLSMRVTPLYVESSLHVCVGTQTDEDDTSWLFTNEELLRKKIDEQEIEMNEMRSRIITLESLLQHLPITDPPHQLNFYSTQNDIFSSPAADAKFTCYLYGDSHVRNLRDGLSLLLPRDCTTRAFFKPGAGIHEVASAIESQPSDPTHPSSNDRVVLMCGTNDICSTQWEIVQEALDNLHTKFQHCEQLCLIQVPLRYDRKKLNFHIQRFNTKVKSYMQSKFNNVYFLNPTKFLKPSDYAVDGLHLNRKGKSKLCNKIKIMLSSNVVSSFNRNTCKSTDLNLTVVPCANLIDFENQEIHERVIPNLTFNESTFSPDSHNYTELFPDRTPSRLFHSSNFVHSILDTPNVPCHINNLINTNPNSSSNYYRLAHLSQYSLNNTVIHSSPIPTISPGYNRSQNENFPDPGQISTT